MPQSIPVIRQLISPNGDFYTHGPEFEWLKSYELKYISESILHVLERKRVKNNFLF